jgi:pimeloyl-ACP methyl ester carboxylesterase
MAAAISPDAEATEAPACQERWWQSSDGLRLFARDYRAASGPARLPVICLHGLTRNSKDFEEVAPRIARTGRRVLAVDVRGRGLSAWDPNPEHYVPKTYARDVLALMESLGIARAVFLGTSMGGIITMALAALRSRAIAAAILNDVGPVVSPAGIERIRSYAGRKVEIADWAEAVDYVRRVNGLAFPDYIEADWQRVARRTFRDVAGVPMLDYDSQIMTPFAKGRYKAPRLLGWLLFRRLARHRPTLLVHGELSDLLSPAIVARMRSHAPRLEYAEVKGVGHAPMLTEPEAWRALETFLSRTA